MEGAQIMKMKIFEVTATTPNGKRYERVRAYNETQAFDKAKHNLYSKNIHNFTLRSAVAIQTIKQN